MKDLHFVTTNTNKYYEVKKIIKSVHQLKIDLKEIQDLNIDKVVEEKLIEAHKKSNKTNIIVEDTALEVEYFNRLPGTFVKYFVQKFEPKEFYEKFKGGRNKMTTITAVGFMNKDGDIMIFKGQVEGRLVYPRGDKNLWGFNSIFEISEVGKTFSEMSTEEKNQYSQRSKAFNKLKKFLEKEYNLRE